MAGPVDRGHADLSDEPRWPLTEEALAVGLGEAGYLADETLVTVAFAACRLRRPLFLEGEPGVGKTGFAQALARAVDTPLVRLQCYEGIDAAQALYDWDFRRQLLYLQAHPDAGETEIHSTSFLLQRPVLHALQWSGPRPPVLLIDEIDRSDEAFEAFLLEVLSDHQVTIPELGTVTSGRPPYVVITSNRTRELHDATKRRCLYHWLAWPTLEREVDIVRVQVPEIPERLAWQLAHTVRRLRSLQLYKSPGVAETLDWARTLLALGHSQLDADVARRSLGAVIKNEQDYARLQGETMDELLADDIA